MLKYADYLKILIALLAVIDPLAAIPVIVIMMRRDNPPDLSAIANTVVLTVTILMLTALLTGEALLTFLGISINSFRVSGGVLLMLMALAMLQGKISETVLNKAEVREGETLESFAVVPLGIPLLAGPGAISTVILYAQKPARHYFSRKLKWGPIRFQQRKMTWRVCLRRPAFVPPQPKTQNIGFRLASYFDLARMT
ncbi:MAG: NAAT family transporter [Gammaproteobacteria bacterium]|nr:NAAT family transporter [Gammaproteobacteria bacterium]